MANLSTTLEAAFLVANQATEESVISSSSIETLLANVSGKTRRETLNGREYIVAPVRMIVEGVLNGSKGALFYPQPEINRDYQAWNGMPIVVYHPTNDKGEPVSARSAKVLNKSGIGMVLESKTESGPLDAEGWFDVEATKRVDNRVYERLLAGKPIELSTGLFTDNHPAPRGATFNGKPYAYVARNYRPDHLAVLPDQKGACSLNDGCGVLINKTDGETTLNKLWSQFKTLFKQLDEAANPTDNALPNQPKSLSTGKFKQMNAGLGKGEAHEAAQRGSLTLTERDKELGVEANQQAEAGSNPPSWAVDESKWERAKTEADKGDYSGDTYWAVVSRIYQNMGGEIKSSTTNSNPEGCNQHTGPECSGSEGKDSSKSGKPVTVGTLKPGDKVRYKGGNKLYKGAIGVVIDKKSPSGAVNGKGTEVAIKWTTPTGMTFTQEANANSLIHNEEYECSGEEGCECENCKSKVVENEDDHSGSSQVDNSIEGEPDMAKLSDVDRKKLVDGLITNCSCQTANIWKEDDRETLNEFSDDKLVGLVKQRKEMVENQLVINTVKEVGGSELAVNAMPEFIKEKMKGKTKKEDGEDGKDDDEGKEVPVKNQSRLTPEEKEDLAFARQVKTERKQHIINQLIVNVAEENRPAKIKALQAKPLAQLEEMLEYIPTRNEETEQRSAPLYYGVGGAPSFTSNKRADFDEDDVLPIPTVNWEQEYAAQRKKANSNAD